MSRITVSLVQPGRIRVTLHLEKRGCFLVIMPNIDEYPERENVPGSETRRNESPKNSARKRLTHAARQVPQKTETAILRSRNSRLATEAKNEERNPLQRFFGTGALGWIAKTVVQSIPFPFTLYGPGDILTGISSGVGRDILSGEHLDGVDRLLYLGATLVPGIPATILVTPARFIRRNVEDAIHARKSGQSTEALIHTKKAFSSARAVIKETRKK
jgi:hypothetical protein